MARTTLSLEQKLENAKNARDRIIQKYNNDRSYMSEKSTEYRSTKNDNLKTIWSDYNKLRRAEKTIRDLEKILEEEDDDNEDNDDDDDDDNQQRATEATSSTIRTRSSTRSRSENRTSERGRNERRSSRSTERRRGSRSTERTRDSRSTERRGISTERRGRNTERRLNTLECKNCHRRCDPAQDNPPFYKFQFVTRRSDNIAKRRIFKHCSFNSNSPVMYNLCPQCDFYLDPQKNYSQTNYDNVVWFSFYWALLSNREVHSKYGHGVWRLIPTEWRFWWLDSLRNAFPNIFGGISLDYPSPAIKDKTSDIKEWNDDISSYLLSKLSSASNKFLRPTVKCPWGCSEFQHKVGFLPVDIVIQRILQKTINKVHTKLEKGFEKRVLSMREDYIRDEDDQEDFLLMNPEWPILPSLAFVDGRGPLILTCNDHNNGTNLFTVHPCRWTHSLPSKQPDQLCQAVIQPRILKPVKASKYTIGFQMFQQSGSFNGIDTCSATSYGRFDFNSKLIRESEARSIANRPDINAHLSKLREEDIISQYAEDGRRSFATSFSSTVNYERLAKGATYVSLESSVILQNENANRVVSAWIDYDDPRRPPVRVSFKKYWSDTLYSCQNMSDYGIRFNKVPILQNRDKNTRSIWKVCVLVSRVESLWRMISNYYELRSSKWHGWMLAYLHINVSTKGIADNRQLTHSSLV